MPTAECLHCHAIIDDPDKKSFLVSLSEHYFFKREDVRLYCGAISKQHVCTSFILEGTTRHIICFGMGIWQEYIDSDLIDEGRIPNMS
jgi:hypothetical protein